MGYKMNTEQTTQMEVEKTVEQQETPSPEPVTTIEEKIVEEITETTEIPSDSVESEIAQVEEKAEEKKVQEDEKVVEAEKQPVAKPVRRKPQRLRRLPRRRKLWNARSERGC